MLLCPRQDTIKGVNDIRFRSCKQFQPASAESVKGYPRIAEGCRLIDVIPDTYTSNTVNSTHMLRVKAGMYSRNFSYPLLNHTFLLCFLRADRI